MKRLVPRASFPLQVRGALFGWLALFFVIARLAAADSYFTTNQPDGIALLPPPPATNSAEQSADFASARNVFKSATAEEKDRAESHATLTIFKFAPAIGEFFQHGNVPKAEAFFERVKASVRQSLNAVKEHWKRSRPYQVDADLKYGKSETSFSYPSGHSTVGMVQALVLAELFPDKREAILEIGRQIGWDRVVIGKHYPTDIYAGRTLAQEIVRQLKTIPDFQHDFADVKIELNVLRPQKSPGK